MADRANWKGSLKLSLVTCPVQLFPASQSQRVSFNMLNPKTGNRIKQQLVDSSTGEKIERTETVRGFAVEKDTYVTVSEDELAAVKLETKHTINIDAFVKRSEIDERFIEKPYYIVPDEDADPEAYAVIREALRKKGMVAVGQVILSRREHMIAIEPYKNGMIGLLLRYPNEVRNSSRYFSEIENVDVDEEMIDLATVIIDRKTSKFDPDKFKDRYEDSLRELLDEKKKGAVLTSAPRHASGDSKVIDLMAALRKSVQGDRRPPAVKRIEPRRAKTKSSPRDQKRRA